MKSKTAHLTTLAEITAGEAIAMLTTLDAERVIVERLVIRLENPTPLEAIA